MSIEHSEDIRLRHVPIVMWVSGALLLIFCFSVLVIGLVYGFFSWYLFAFIAFSSVIALSSSSLIFAPLTTVDLCPKSKYIQISSTRIYGKRVDRYYFSQVTKFKSYKGKINFSQQYFLALVLANRKTIKLNLPIGHDKQETVKLIKKLNKIIRTSSRGLK